MILCKIFFLAFLEIMSNTNPDYNHPLFSLSFGTISAVIMISIVLVVFLIQYVSFKKSKIISNSLVIFVILASLFYIFAAIFLTIFLLFYNGYISD